MGVLRIWDGVGGDASLISSVRIYIYYMGLLLVGSIIKFSLLIIYIYIYIQHTHKSSNPIHSLSHALLLLLLRLASLISAIPCLLETIPVHECAQYTPLRPYFVLPLAHFSYNPLLSFLSTTITTLGFKI